VPSAVAVLLAGSILAAPAAQAATPTSDPHTAAAVAAGLGDRAVGAYRDPATKTMVIAVTDEPAAATVRAKGARPHLVAHSRARLRQITADLDRNARVPGTAWAIDPRTDQVVVTVDDTVGPVELDAITAVADRAPGAVHIARRAGQISLRISGGDAIHGGGYRCSLGFNVRADDGTPYFLTAGHCGNIASDWFSDRDQSGYLGWTAASDFPRSDHAIVQYADGVSHPSSVDLYDGSSQPITGAADAYVGESVTRSGSTTGVHSGTVQAVDATVNYAQGTVYGLIQADVCAEGGDSGGALFDGENAIGLTSGGSGNCTSGGTTFFQPVTAALNAYGVAIG
jgi:streptogrisin D